MTEVKKIIIIRQANPGDEAFIHKAHMRSIREVCVKDHGEDEIKGWGFRPLGIRWIDSIKNEFVRVVVYEGTICGVGSLKIVKDVEDDDYAFLHSLYLTPEVLGQGVGKELALILINEALRLNLKMIKLDSTITA